MFERPHTSSPESNEIPHEYRIIACIGDKETFSEEDKVHLEELEAEPVEFSSPETVKEELHQRSAGFNTYTISAVNEHSKSSKDFINCTGLAIVGVDKETGSNVSVVTHERPSNYLNTNKQQFEEDLGARLREFAERTVPGTIDVGIVGGRRSLEPSTTHTYTTTHSRDYIDGVDFLADKIRTIIGVEPRVIAGPTDIHGAVSLFFDTQHRRLFVYKTEQSKLSKTFDVPAKDLRRQIWKSKTSRH